MKELKDGSKTLTTSLSDGATTVKDNSASNETIKMFATPVVNDETKLTDVQNNGHAMAPYMMSEIRFRMVGKQSFRPLSGSDPSGNLPDPAVTCI